MKPLVFIGVLIAFSFGAYLATSKMFDVGPYQCSVSYQRQALKYVRRDALSTSWQTKDDVRLAKMYWNQIRVWAETIENRCERRAYLEWADYMDQKAIEFAEVKDMAKPPEDLR